MMPQNLLRGVTTLVVAAVLLAGEPSVSAFVVPKTLSSSGRSSTPCAALYIFGNNNKNKKANDLDSYEPGRNKISDKRRQQLGIMDNEDEYDLGMALRNNTDDTISKIIAGSLIVTMIALLVAGIVIPATTDYGDGVCNPMLTAGRC